MFKVSFKLHNLCDFIIHVVSSVGIVVLRLRGSLKFQPFEDVILNVNWLSNNESVQMTQLDD